MTRAQPAARRASSPPPPGRGGPGHRDGQAAPREPRGALDRPPPLVARVGVAVAAGAAAVRAGPGERPGLRNRAARPPAGPGRVVERERRRRPAGPLEDLAGAVAGALGHAGGAEPGVGARRRALEWDLRCPRPPTSPSRTRRAARRRLLGAPRSPARTESTRASWPSGDGRRGPAAAVRATCRTCRRIWTPCCGPRRARARPRPRGRPSRPSRVCHVASAGARPSSPPPPGRRLAKGSTPGGLSFAGGRAPALAGTHPPAANSARFPMRGLLIFRCEFCSVHIEYKQRAS